MSVSTFITSTSAPMHHVSLVSPSAFERNIQTDIQEFWSSFPCPPPWKPRLLIEVNISRLDPLVSKTVKSFLAGKCDIRHILAGSGDVHNFESSDFIPNIDFRPTDSQNPRSSMRDPETSRLKWCDTTCQLTLGCALFFVVALMMVSLLVCVNKHRVRHKMAATRPSRQQLQLSASTSDTANCAEFSNLEIQREEMIYPPFRHRGLPNLPRSCHPSCDANWNCPNCSSCHPLMGFGHADQYYSHAYSAVYEAIDDFDEEDNEKTENADEILSREVTTIILQPDELHPSCSPCEGLPPEINSDQLQSRPADDKKYVQKVAETGFNGVEHAENVPTSTLPKYFDLKHNSAISRPYDSIIHNHHHQNPSIVSNTTEYCNSSYLNCGHHSILPTQCEYPMLANSPLHSFVMSQVHNKVIPSASELYMPKTGRESSTRYVVDGINNDQHKTSNILSTAYCKGHTDRSLMQLGDRLSYTNSDPNMQQKQRRLDLHNSKKSNPTFANIPCQSLCPGCQQDSSNYFTDQQNIPPSNKK